MTTILSDLIATIAERGLTPLEPGRRRDLAKTADDLLDLRARRRTAKNEPAHA